MNRDEQLGLRPLTARSVLLSALLGTTPPRLPVGRLVRAAELFGITIGEKWSYNRATSTSAGPIPAIS